MNFSHALRRGVDQEKSLREPVRREIVLLLSSEARGTATGDDAMTGGSVTAGVSPENRLSLDLLYLLF
jgi:hypothetical protein